MLFVTLLHTGTGSPEVSFPRAEMLEQAAKGTGRVLRFPGRLNSSFLSPASRSLSGLQAAVHCLFGFRLLRLYIQVFSFWLPPKYAS